MGMAASQARYLGLQARKTNTEYEGQQVNQQRTALANQSAGLFRRLLELQVPTPPSQEDYKKETYSFSDASSVSGSSTLESIEENAGSSPTTYTVTIKRQENVPQYGALANQEVSVIKNSETEYSINLSNGTQFTLNGPVTGISQTLCDEFNKTGAASYQNEAGDTYYKFTNPTNKATYYINASKTGFDPTDTSTQDVDFFTTMTAQQNTYQTVNNATLGKSEDGLYTSLYWTDDSGTHNYALSPSSEYDEAGYDAAMNQYNYEKMMYEKEVEDINAKTEELQETDRTLELRLKQLDTEQEALQTELESVKKVIDKNIENVFKTFQS